MLGKLVHRVFGDKHERDVKKIAPLVEQCRFSDCSHQHEPGCAVLAALEEGAISAERYDSYLRLREEHQQLEDDLF